MNKKLRLSAFLSPCLCTLLVFCLTACSKNFKQIHDISYENDAMRLEQALTCYNTKLGVSMTIPRGWWVYDLNTANFSPDPSDTVNAAAFDIIYEADSTRIELISYANHRFSNKNKHLGFEVIVETRKESYKNKEYGSYLEEYLLKTPWNGSFSLQDSGFVAIGNTSFEKQVYNIMQTTQDSESNYKIISFTTLLKTGADLIITASFWPTNRNAESAILALINRALTLE